MILADTSVWVDYLRQRDPLMKAFLGAGEILVHPFVTGELAVGNLRDREDTLHELRSLPQAIVANEDYFLHVLVGHRLFGTGLGFVDVHLLASALLEPPPLLWTRDRRLHSACVRLKISANILG
ncbi:VapC toxin family PIN domain ribonuclease [Pseudoduganella sp. LjRoot289]|uniref:type II toxin-antitoxin system VapC family toxin n=1 Tax=Pseudoduganella sp. LjRoot289 TaxID=3342314 RepID=UPI003ED006C5